MSDSRWRTRGPLKSPMADVSTGSEISNAIAGRRAYSRRCWIPGSTFDILKSCRKGSDSKRVIGAHFYAQAHISTQPSPSRQDARLSFAHEDKIRGSGVEPSPRGRPQARLRQRWISRLSLSRRFVLAGVDLLIFEPPAETPFGNAMSTPSNCDARQARSSDGGLRQSLAGSRLRLHADFQRAYATSLKRRSTLMTWFLAPQLSPVPGPRVGLTVGKVIGKAHERNRIKRRLREVLRRHVDLLPQGCDLILHPHRSVLTVEFTKLDAEVLRILRQASAEAARTSTAAVAPDSNAEPAK
jgi:ribonuclease P protein component